MLSTSKVVAGGLAAATAAVFGSYFGTLGTVGAAAAASVVTALTSEVFQRSIDRTAGALRPGRRADAGRSPGPGQGPDARLRPDPGRPEPRSVPGPDGPAPARRGTMAGLVVGSVLVFALGMAAVTGIEKLTEEPLSGGAERTTTIGHLTHLDVGSAVGDLVGGSGADSGEDRKKDGLLGGLLGL